MTQKSNEAGELQPSQQQEADDAHYRALASQVDNWTGGSVSDIPQAVLDHCPELLEAENLKATVPLEYRGLVRGKRTEVDVHNSCAFKEYCVRLFAIDEAGQALIRKTTHHAYEDVDDNRFETMPKAEALSLVARYRRDAVFLAGPQQEGKMHNSRIIDERGIEWSFDDEDRSSNVTPSVAGKLLEFSEKLPQAQWQTAVHREWVKGLKEGDRVEVPFSLAQEDIKPMTVVKNDGAWIRLLPDGFPDQAEHMLTVCAVSGNVLHTGARIVPIGTVIPMEPENAVPDDRKLPQTMSRATKDVSNKEPFEVPAINNEKLALMRHLKLNGEDDTDYDKVKELEGFKLDSNDVSSTYAVSVFEYNNERYHVAHATAELEANVLQEFNSNFWRIRKVEGAESVNQHASCPSPGM